VVVVVVTNLVLPHRAALVAAVQVLMITLLLTPLELPTQAVAADRVEKVPAVVATKRAALE
jgi:hypothetical protein